MDLADIIINIKGNPHELSHGLAFPDLLESRELRMFLLSTLSLGLWIITIYPTFIIDHQKCKYF